MSRRDLFDSSVDSPWRWDDLLIAAGLLGFLFAVHMGWL